ncbi:MAG TPA: NAD(P)/FAD-dependent oxidoreductase [Mycobacterium sp.]|jgi:NADH dehydrogenase|nr:NAD(P)/FAD-dependent oxidoreductase [Mycobacterium sp.]
MTRHRVVVVGSGFGGLTATKALKNAPVDVTMIARTQHHLFQGLLYQVATGILSEGEIAPATRTILRNQPNVDVVLGDVVDVNLADRYVVSELLGQRYRTSYDSLIIAAGANQSYFGNDHFAEFAPGMKTIDDALEVRGRILGALELAERTSDPARRAQLLTFTVVGAGPTGVELAGQVVELTTQTMKREFRRIDPKEVRVILLDALPTVLTAMGPKLGTKAQDRLQRIGVDVQLGVTVIDVDREGLTVRDSDGSTRRIESACKVWSAGVAASPLGRLIAEQSGAAIDRAGRVEVLPDLTVPGHSNVFVIGDMASVPGVPGMAQGAIQGGKYAARAITAGSQSGDRSPFRYVDLGSMATVSRFSAVVKIGPLEYGGFLGWVSWLGLHLARMVGFKSKFTTFISWTVTFLTTKRGQLTITGQQVYARTRAPID